MASVTDAENTKIIKQYRSRLNITCKRSDDIRDIVFYLLKLNTVKKSQLISNAEKTLQINFSTMKDKYINTK